MTSWTYPAGYPPRASAKVKGRSKAALLTLRGEWFSTSRRRRLQRPDCDRDRSARRVYFTADVKFPAAAAETCSASSFSSLSGSGWKLFAETTRLFDWRDLPCHQSPSA